MTPLDIGNAFDQILQEDENGSAWVVFPDLPTFQYPDFNNQLLVPMILFVKMIAFFKPDLRRLNGRRVALALFASAFILFYVFLTIVF